MELATDEAVLGDFNDAVFERFGVTTRFFRDGPKYMVNTEGPDGELHDYEVKYTFGVTPAAAVHGRVSRRPGAGAPRLVGHAQEGVVLCHAPRRDRRTDRAGRSAALDRHRPELEHHLRGVPLDRPAEELRPRHEHLPHDLRGDRRQLRGVPRAGEPARRAGPGELVVLGPPARLRAGEAQVAGHSLRDRDLRQVPLVPPRRPPRLSADQATAGQLRAEPAARVVLPRRRADRGRGLRLRIVPAEQDVLRGRALHELPRPALAEAEVRGERALRPVPCAGEVRHPRSPSPQAGHARGELRRVPHARNDVHGGRSAARPQHPHPAARPDR